MTNREALSELARGPPKGNHAQRADADYAKIAEANPKDIAPRALWHDPFPTFTDAHTFAALLDDILDRRDHSRV